jgi:hypothetical protein
MDLFIPEPRLSHEPSWSRWLKLDLMWLSLASEPHRSENGQSQAELSQAEPRQH